MEKKKAPNKKMLLSVLFLIVMMVVTFYVIFKDNSIDDILRSLKQVNPWYIAGGLLMAVGYMVFQALALRAPMKSLDTKTSFGEFLGYSFVGFYFSGITPSSTGGQPMQLYYMRRRGISVADASLSLLLANIAWQLVVMLYGLVMLVLRFHFVSGSVRGMTALIILGYAVAAILVVALFFVMFSKTFAQRVVVWVVGVLAKLRLIKDRDDAIGKAQDQIAEYNKGAKTIRHRPKLFAYVLLVTFAQMTCYLLVPFFVYKAFGFSGHNILDLVAVQAILYMAVSYLPIPGAVGASEKTFVSMFSLFFTAETIIPAMLISRGITFYALLIVSGVVTAVMQLKGRRELRGKIKPLHRSNAGKSSNVLKITSVVGNTEKSL